VCVAVAYKTRENALMSSIFLLSQFSPLPLLVCLSFCRSPLFLSLTYTMAAADNELHDVVAGEHGGVLDQLVAGTGVGLVVGERERRG
jgi:hypothetical protein